MIAEVHKEEKVFKIGDEVWFIFDNTIYKASINEIHIFEIKGMFGIFKKIKVKYKMFANRWLSSYEVFHTKEELIESITHQDWR